MKTTRRKRKTTKKVIKKTHKSNKFLKYITYLLLLFLLVIIMLIIGYYIGYKDASSNIINKHTQQNIKKNNIPSTVILSKKLENILKQQNKTIPLKYTIKPIITAKFKINKKPKLAIVLDDISFAYQVRDIKALHLRLTMSFFPPNYIHPDTAMLASKQPFYMVHLPLEAIEFHHPEPHTLMISDSLQTISNRIKSIKKEFPKLKYINNHTGSTFTANKQAMQKLIFVLKKYHLQFVDSKTTSYSKAPEVTKEYHMRYIARDVFLDDKQNVAYIKNQLKEAIDIAKHKGYAIAIGHPHDATLKALAESKQLLKQVRLVYVNQI